jgi:hypothetical protein
VRRLGAHSVSHELADERLDTSGTENV